MFALPLLTVLALVGGCGAGNTGEPDRAVDGAHRQGELTLVSRTPIPIEESAPYVWFTGESPRSLAQNGSFEQWSSGEPYPAGWEALVKGPSAVQEKSIVRFGPSSLYLSSESETRMRPILTIGDGKVRGRRVYFGGWIYTANPETVGVQVIEDWKRYTVARPTKSNEWELVYVETDIEESTLNVQFAFTIGLAAAAGNCYVDGAGLVIKDW